MIKNFSDEISYAQFQLQVAERHVENANYELARAKRRLNNATLKPEAIMRMNRLGINPDAIEDFRANGRVVMYSADLDKFFSPMAEEKAIIRKLEHDFSAMVYFVFAQAAYFGPGAIVPMASFLYVSPEVVQLEHDSPIYGPNLVFAYTHCYDEPIDSEYGDVPVQRTHSGGLRRLTLREQDELNKQHEQARIIQAGD